MVYQIHSDVNVVDIKVCSISFQQHLNSVVLNRFPKSGKKLYKRSNMDRHPLPVVELRPFSKKVWRREKSFPDFYERKKFEEPITSASNAKDLEVHPPPSRLGQEGTADARKTIESRQNTFDSSLGKYRSHPKAEFQHESNRAWRKQDLIPSFITRSERTKTSLDALSRDSSNTALPQRIALEQPSFYENSLKKEPNPSIKISGGRMNQQIHRRHLLYLNPLDTYRQPNSWVPHFNSTNPTRQNTTRDKYITFRHSFPLTSSRTRDFILGETQTHSYPLKPIRREDAESPHKFNNKLGAARNSLEVLSKIGIQTRLEKKLEKEMELNMEKSRKDRLMLTSDLKGGVPFHYLHFETNMTVGELSLRNAREANKPVKGKHHHHPTSGRKDNDALLGDVGYNGTGMMYEADPTNTPHVTSASGVDPNPMRQHVISQPLVEETETRSVVDAYVNFPHSYPGGVGGDKTEKITNEIEPSGKKNETYSNDEVLNASGSKELPNNATTTNNDKGITEINNNSIAPDKGHPPQTIDSSRIETNVAYLENLHLKSSLGVQYPPPETGNAEPPPNFSKSTAENSRQNELSNIQEAQSSSQPGHHAPLHQAPTSGQPQPTNPPQSQQLSTLSPLSQPTSQQAQSQSTPVPTTQPLNGSTPQQEGQSLSEEVNHSLPPNQPQMNVSSIPESGATLNGERHHLKESGAMNDKHHPTESGATSGERPLSGATNGERHLTESGGIDSAREELAKVLAAPESQDISMQGTTTDKPAAVEEINASPLTSSGFESQPTTDQEDELSPGGSDDPSTPEKIESQRSHGHVQYIPGEVATEDTKTRNVSQNDKPVSDGDDGVAIPNSAGNSVSGRGEAGGGVSDNNKESHPGSSKSNDDGGDSGGGEPGRVKDKEVDKIQRNKNVPIASSAEGKRVMQYSPGEDEGISLVPSDAAAILDSSTVEASSDHEGATGCADNGDSGISTTFLTSEESVVPEVLGGILTS